MKTSDEIRHKNLLIAIERAGSASNLSRITGISTAYISQIKTRQPESKTGKPRAMGDEMARKIETAINEKAGWMDNDHSETTIRSNKFEPDYLLQSANNVDQGTGLIEYWNVRGSCGGGFLNYDQMPKGHLVKEDSFFKKFGLKPENAFAIYADGESMAEFIVDGDIVIFDRSRTEPVSGKIFAIEHPDGLRIKQLRRSIDGAWILESKNQDKRAFPDEVISTDHGELLKIHGQFVYRQGG